MKYLMLILLLGGALALHTACGSKGSGPATPPQDAPPPTVVTPQNQCSCGVNQGYSAQFGCLQRGACSNGYAYEPTSQQCVAATLVQYGTCNGTAAYKRFGYSLQIKNADQFKLLLRYARVCDPYIIGWNIGAADCDTYKNAGFVIIETTGGFNTAVITIGGGANQPFDYSNIYSYLYGGSQYVTFSVQAQVRPTNSNAGVELVGVDIGGNDMGLRARSDNGTMASSTIPLTFTYQGVTFATAPVQAY